MARLQMHHVTYNPPWEVEVTRQMHTCLGTIQMTKATEEQYARLINFQHALSHEVNRMRAELDTKKDLRVVKRGMKKGKRNARVRKTIQL